MDGRTGEMYDAATAAKMIENGQLNPKTVVRIPDEYAEELGGMNRKERRDWYKKNKKALGLKAWGEM